jgi:hypothetical protein
MLPPSQVAYTGGCRSPVAEFSGAATSGAAYAPDFSRLNVATASEP